VLTTNDVAKCEAWFDSHGLPYFVEAGHEAIQRALVPRIVGLWAVLVCWWILVPWALVLHWRPVRLAKAFKEGTPAAPRQAQLVDHEAGEQDGRGGQTEPRPFRKALLAALD